MEARTNNGWKEYVPYLVLDPRSVLSSSDRELLDREFDVGNPDLVGKPVSYREKRRLNRLAITHDFGKISEAILHAFRPANFQARREAAIPLFSASLVSLGLPVVVLANTDLGQWVSNPAIFASSLLGIPLGTVGAFAAYVVNESTTPRSDIYRLLRNYVEFSRRPGFGQERNGEGAFATAELSDPERELAPINVPIRSFARTITPQALNVEAGATARTPVEISDAFSNR